MEQGNTAIVIINSLRGVRSPALTRWLARGTVTGSREPSGLAVRVLNTMGVASDLASPAAHRFLGQTGELPDAWIAAADPVYLEPRLDHLCLHTLSSVMRDGELERLVAHLNDCLGDTAEFVAVGSCGYLRCGSMPVSGFDPDALHGYVPDKFLPAGEGVDTTRRLQSEIEMALHEHPVNLARQADGLQPVNALWLWGGGERPVAPAQDLPPLYADDPLLRGTWSSSGVSAERWSGSLEPVFATGGVAVVPEDDEMSIDNRLDTLRAAFDGGKVRELRLLTRDGVEFGLSRGDQWKFWRREFQLPVVGA